MCAWPHGTPHSLAIALQKSFTISFILSMKLLLKLAGNTIRLEVRLAITHAENPMGLKVTLLYADYMYMYKGYTIDKSTIQ